MSKEKEDEYMVCVFDKETDDLVLYLVAKGDNELEFIRHSLKISKEKQYVEVETL